MDPLRPKRPPAEKRLLAPDKCPEGSPTPTPPVPSGLCGFGDGMTCRPTSGDEYAGRAVFGADTEIPTAVAAAVPPPPPAAPAAAIAELPSTTALDS